MSENNQAGGTSMEGALSDASLEELQRKRRARRRAIILALVALFLLVVAVAFYYLLGPKPIATLPVVRNIARGTPPTYQFSIYGVNQPFGVAASPDGNRIFVTESGGERQLKIFDRDGRPIISVSPYNTSPGSRAPVYVVTDEDGNAFMVDRISSAIYSFDYDGRMLKAIAPVYDDSTAGLKDFGWAPLGISFTPQGNMLLTNVSEGKHSLMSVDMDGKVLWAFGQEGEAEDQLEFPNQAITDGKGRIFVSNSNMHRVTVFSEKGDLLGNISSSSDKEGLQLPRGLMIDDLDRLYIVNAFDHSVKVYDIAANPPKYLFTFGAFGVGNGQFQFPNSIARDVSGRIYVTDRENSRVQVWSY